MKQDIDEVSTIQRYPIGLSYPVANPLDLRRFHYGKAGGALDNEFGAKCVTPQIVTFAEINAPAQKGERLLAIDVAVTDGVLGDGIIAKDELAGGYIIILTPPPMRAINRMIVANTAQLDPAGGVMVVTLDKPLPRDIDPVTNFHAECMANPYMDVVTGNYPLAPVVGMPTLPAALGEFLWFQTWGPLWGITQLRAGVGDHNRQLVFRHDGSIDMHDPTDGTTMYQQHAGFIMANTLAGGQGAPFTFLQITP